MAPEFKPLARAGAAEETWSRMEHPKRRQPRGDLVPGSTLLLRAHEDGAVPASDAGSCPTTDVQSDAIAKAALAIRIILARTVERAAEEIGTYVLGAFYDDDPAAYASRSHKKHASLALLELRCGTQELPISKTFLSTAIRIVLVARSLPPGASFGMLPVSHRRELLRLPTPETMEELSARALADRSTVLQLRARVDDIIVKPRRLASPAGRALKVLRRVAGTLAHKGRPLLSAAHLRDLSAAERSALRKELDRAGEAIAQLTRALSEAS